MRLPPAENSPRTTYKRASVSPINLDLTRGKTELFYCCVTAEMRDVTAEHEEVTWSLPTLASSKCLQLSLSNRRGATRHYTAELGSARRKHRFVYCCVIARTCFEVTVLALRKYATIFINIWNKMYKYLIEHGHILANPERVCVKWCRGRMSHESTPPSFTRTLTFPLSSPPIIQPLSSLECWQLYEKLRKIWVLTARWLLFRTLEEYTIMRRKWRVSGVVIPTIHGASLCGNSITLSNPAFYSVDPKSILIRVR
jgi:hypothetical protein